MTIETARATARSAAVAATLTAIREIAPGDAIQSGALQGILRQLIELAAQSELFPLADFPPPGAAEQRNSCLYRIAEDDDHHYALYVNSAAGEYGTPAHNHTTWAVIAGIQGQEHNRFYQRDATQGVRQTGSKTVEPGTGVAFLPDDLHSIHIEDTGPVLNFHMYGLGLEQLHRREYYSRKDGQWHVFEPHSDIREARPDGVTV